MPIKFGEIDNAQFFVMQDGEYKPLGHISEVVLTAEPDTESEECKRYFSASPIEFTFKSTVNMKALYIFFITGNDLYIKFPKKLRRRRRR